MIFDKSSILDEERGSYILVIISLSLGTILMILFLISNSFSICLAFSSFNLCPYVFDLRMDDFFGLESYISSDL